MNNGPSEDCCHVPRQSFKCMQHEVEQEVERKVEVESERNVCELRKMLLGRVYGNPSADSTHTHPRPSEVLVADVAIRSLKILSRALAVPSPPPRLICRVGLLKHMLFAKCERWKLLFPMRMTCSLSNFVLMSEGGMTLGLTCKLGRFNVASDCASERHSLALLPKKASLS